ncbi:TPA: hypothetical protein DEQ22_02220 [Candidatus Nomurabacteria bacterium]|uniref:DUF5652 domain-containing protein n=2 Tax=Candidatus Nomuraibacteriota TaxID=1752729 RepID=A0A1F6YQ46_9BACT|nr:MAG: Membrane protein [Parcubacteria group bacterium GW2011_GWC1_42_21]KKS58101.1 MAG: Membrane protein [Candidatus Nomurabacteria bacterium GW2011_GWF1_42_40]KKS99520.1 MAG: Membrane protein [Candidatus Nomurabacteria bacterium GW2011_GWA1_43_17]KKT06356.1 MAG: Membrane protein [Candidatus Nomurabacteria bacterium GW2011_GWB1_43_19]KKT10542.1 MAG: Membrane protein [Candidatus Nomurabacteria bacterium GW2011_GWF2_43_24]KKT17574.1 MAG: Membrane protein [Candidatus Nomurabacteria bacterium GW
MYNIYNINLVLLIVALWTIPWKIYAVWTAAKHNHKKWFVALLILNTVAILEIFYIFKIAKKSWADVKRDFKRALSSIR